MLFIDTFLGPSSLDGIGLFARTEIPRGAVVWRFVPGFDYILRQDDFAKLPEIARRAVLHYTYFSEDLDGFVVMPDDARFFNHSDTPNTLTVPDCEGCPEPMTIAARDIAAGEELTSDYHEYDKTVALKNLPQGRS